MLSRWRIPMRLGYFAMPLHPPGADPARTMDDDLVQLATLDRLGYEEAWIGEHFTAQWENIPCPDLFIARALGMTKRMTLATGVSCLPNHDPLMLAQRLAHRRPYQTPPPPIGVAGVTANSETLVLAGERGYIPMSINFVPPRILKTHWEAVETGAKRAGRIADRKTWRIARDVFVADTDAKAPRGAWERSMRLLKEEVVPRLSRARSSRSRAAGPGSSRSPRRPRRGRAR